MRVAVESRIQAVLPVSMVILCIYKLGIYIEVRVRILKFYDFGGGVTDIKLIY